MNATCSICFPNTEICIHKVIVITVLTNESLHCRCIDQQQIDIKKKIKMQIFDH